MDHATQGAGCLGPMTPVAGHYAPHPRLSPPPATRSLGGDSADRSRAGKKRPMAVGARRRASPVTRIPARRAKQEGPPRREDTPAGDGRPLDGAKAPAARPGIVAGRGRIDAARLGTSAAGRHAGVPVGALLRSVTEGEKTNARAAALIEPAAGATRESARHASHAQLTERDVLQQGWLRAPQVTQAPFWHSPPAQLVSLAALAQYLPDTSCTCRRWACTEAVAAAGSADSSRAPSQLPPLQGRPDAGWPCTCRSCVSYRGNRASSFSRPPAPSGS